MGASYDMYLKYLKDSDLVMPTQSTGAHRLDREVINYSVGMLKEQNVYIACVRSAFAEGHPVYPDSAFYNRAHVQIVVRDIDRCINRTWLEPEPGSAR